MSMKEGYKSKNKNDFVQTRRVNALNKQQNRRSCQPAISSDRQVLPEAASSAQNALPTPLDKAVDPKVLASAPVPVNYLITL